VVVLEEAIVQVGVGLVGLLLLVVAGGDVADLVEVVGANLGNVHVDKVRVVTVQFEKFVLAVQVFEVDVVGHIDVLVGQDVAWLLSGVTGNRQGPCANVFADFVLVDSEEEVLLCDDFLISLALQLELLLLVLVVNKSQFLRNN